jgi:hypothetical protein
MNSPKVPRLRVSKPVEQDFYLLLRDGGPAPLTARFWGRNLAPSPRNKALADLGESYFISLIRAQTITLRWI